jgi:hypothetical protein
MVSLVPFYSVTVVPFYSAVRTNFVVSNNTRHFPPEDNEKRIYEGIEYVTARQFLDIIGLEDQET